MKKEYKIPDKIIIGGKLKQNSSLVIDNLILLKLLEKNHYRLSGHVVILTTSEIKKIQAYDIGFISNYRINGALMLFETYRNMDFKSRKCCCRIGSRHHSLPFTLVRNTLTIECNSISYHKLKLSL